MAAEQPCTTELRIEMRLKYYLRGLGIGMVAAAVLMGAASGRGQTLSDAQIRERAAELGMVESTPAVLSDLETPQSETLPEALPEAGQESRETMEEPPGTQALQPEETETLQSEAAEAQQPEETEALQPEAAPEVSVTIQPGDSSVTVSRMLAEAGLVEDAEAFDRYLCDNGYSKSLRIGTYQIEPGTGEEEIAEIITGKQ